MAKGLQKAGNLLFVNRADCGIRESRGHQPSNLNQPTGPSEDTHYRGIISADRH